MPIMQMAGLRITAEQSLQVQVAEGRVYSQLYNTLQSIGTHPGSFSLVSLCLRIFKIVIALNRK